MLSSKNKSTDAKGEPMPSHCIDPKPIANLLEAYNQWRRSDGAEMESSWASFPFTTKEINEAIDFAVKVLRTDWSVRYEDYAKLLVCAHNMAKALELSCKRQPCLAAQEFHKLLRHTK